MFKRKENLMFRILKIFSLTLITIITLFAIVVGIFLVRQDFIVAQKGLSDVGNRLLEITMEKQKFTDRVLDEINDKNQEFQSLN